jgi:hypothetical protein
MIIATLFSMRRNFPIRTKKLIFLKKKKKALCNVSCDFHANIWKQRWKNNTTKFQYENSFWIIFKRMLLRNRWWKKKSHHQKNFSCLRLMIHHRLNQRRLAILLQSKYRDFFLEKKFQTKKWLIFFRKNQLLNKENNFSFRKKSFLCSNSSKLSNELFEIENVSLNVLTMKNINFRINVINIVQKKRIRKFSKDFANTI